LAVLLLEPHGARLRVAPFVALGAAVSAYLGQAVLTGPIAVVVHPHALQYVTGVRDAGVWTVLHILAVIGPSVLSGYPTIVAFGLLNLVGLSVVALVYVDGVRGRVRLAVVRVRGPHVGARPAAHDPPASTARPASAPGPAARPTTPCHTLTCHALTCHALTCPLTCHALTCPLTCHALTAG